MHNHFSTTLEYIKDSILLNYYAWLREKNIVHGI
jgi:hypothetical protein